MAKTVRPLRQTETIEARGDVALEGLAEIEKSVGKRHGLKGRPQRRSQVIAGFHDNHEIGRAGDGEVKLIALDAETGGGLNHRVPFHRQETGGGGESAPAGCTRQIIDRQAVVRIENGLAQRRSIAQEVTGGQRRPFESGVSDKRDAGRNGY